MPKGVPNKKYTAEFKKLVVETMLKEKLGYAHMLRLAVLCSVIFHPVEEDNATRYRRSDTVHPLAVALEPSGTDLAVSKLGCAAIINIATLVKAPANKAGAPFYAVRVAIPAPIGLATHVTYLGQGNSHQHFIGICQARGNAIKDRSPHRRIFRRQQFRELLSLILIEAMIHPHVFCCFVFNRDVEIDDGNGLRRFHKVTFSVIHHNGVRFILHLRAGRQFIHIPEYFSD